jgi:diguanylate cyclase (GGDEF)-like protein
MRKAVAIHGASEEVLALVPILEDNPEIEIVGVFAADPEAAAGRARAMNVEVPIGNDPALFSRPLHAVVDVGEPAFAASFPDAAAQTQVVSPLTARLLWGYGTSGSNHKHELLQALHEVIESVNLTVDPDELFCRMLEIAMGVTGADGGSLMLLDPESGELGIRVAIGVEPELWDKIRVPIGEGIAGRVAADARPLKVRGRAGREDFNLVRARLDVESALCVPLVHEGQVLGVLNLHHGTRADVFDDDDLEFAEQLGMLDAQIIAQAQAHEVLRRQASRYEAVRAVRETLTGDDGLDRRLEGLCHRVAKLLGGGIATIYLHDESAAELRLAATSLEGRGLGGDYRIKLGQGIDGKAASEREPKFIEGAGGAIALAALPLLAGQKLVGVLSVQSGSGPFASGTRALRETVLEIAAAAAEEIAQAEREARMSAQNTKIGAINETGIRLVSAKETAEVCRLSTSSGALILEADHSILRLQDPETRRYVIRSYYGSADRRTQEQLFRLDKQVSVDTLKSRQARLIQRLGEDASTAELAGGLRSALAAPLRNEGRIVGTLAFYDKIGVDQFFASSFHEDDLHVFQRYVSYVERALETARVWSATKEHRNFDEDTGLPNGDYLNRRLDQELARANGREGAFALVNCSIENLDAVRDAHDAGRAERILLRAADALKASLREFDVLARTGDAEFQILLPDPGPTPEERITALARAVAEEIGRHTGGDGARAGLAFGYAVHPADGADRETLTARIRAPRIRMV